MPTTQPADILETVKRNIVIPSSQSHKGQNGRLLVIGGSHIFHSASLWSAEIASRFVDLVHYSSTKENADIFVNLKSKFANGIVIPREELLDYVQEDDCILIGPGMERGDIPEGIVNNQSMTFQELLQLEDEAQYTYCLIRFLIKTFPEKKFVFDAAALQVMDPSWMLRLRQKPIITPHSKEYQKLFGLSASEHDFFNSLSSIQIIEHVQHMSQQYNAVIILKRITDYIADGDKIAMINGGNEGLTKGGSGDALAGLITAFNTRSDQFSSCVMASYIVKAAAERLFQQKGSFYNTSDLIGSIPTLAAELLY